MQGIEKIAKLVCDYLNQHEIDYVVVGGLAAVMYGHLRVTGDIDFLIEVKQKDIKPFIDFLNEHDFYADPEDIEIAFNEKSHFSALEKESSFRLDIKGIYTENDRLTLKNRRGIDLEGTLIFMASPEDTIANKLVNGSNQDMEDAKWIFLRQYPRIDFDQLEQRCSGLKVRRKLDVLRHQVETIIDNEDEKGKDKR